MSDSRERRRSIRKKYPVAARTNFYAARLAAYCQMEGREELSYREGAAEALALVHYDHVERTLRPLVKQHADEFRIAATAEAAITGNR